MAEFRILGPLEVVEGERPVVLGGPKVRALLAMLLLHRGEVVSIDRLIDALWGERASGTAAKTVQVYVSNQRKALGDGLLVTRAPGYVLETTPAQVDADRFEELVAQGRGALESGDPREASRALRDALALDPPSRRSGPAPVPNASRARRGALLITAGGAVLAAVIALVAVRLADSSASART